MIKKIIIKNFKSLKNFEIEPKPLTLLFGANSTGKSNYIKALLFFKKNVLFRERQTDTPKQLSYKINENLDLISFDEIVSDGNCKNVISFEFILDFQYWFPKNIIKKFMHEIYFDNEKEGELIKSNISLKFEFKKGVKKEYLSYFSFKDLDKDYYIYFNISEFGFFNVSGTESLKERYKNLYLYNRSPFIGYTGNYFIHSYDEFAKGLQKDLGLNDEQASNFEAINEKYYSERVDEFRQYYLISYLIPYFFFTYFSTFHLPQVREVPRKFYELEENKFGSKVYYDLLDYLYEYQESIIEFLLKECKKKRFSVNEKYKKFFDINKNLNDIRKKVSDYTIKNLLVDYNEETWQKLSQLNKKREKYVKKYLKNKKKFSVKEEQKRSNNFNKYLHINDKKVSDIIIKNLFEVKSEKTRQEISKLTIKERKILKKLLNSHIGGIADSYDLSYEFSDDFLRNISFNLNKMLSDLGFAGYIYISKLNDIGSINIIRENYQALNFKNESSGLTQLIPILIGLCILMSVDYSEDVYTFHNMSYSDDKNINLFKSLYVEQPELHLHPKLQSGFMNIVFEILKKFTPGKNIIIETHSENILKKIQIEIKNGNVKKEDVGIFCFENKNGTNAKELIIGNDGFFESELPDGFFDEGLKLTEQLLFGK